MTTESRLSDEARPIRVLVVDDSVVVRRLLSRAFEHAGGFEIAGSAANGRLALNKLELAKPDVIVLDLEMPEMNGYEMLAELRRRRSDLPVVVFSHLGDAGGAASDALALGAHDVIVKPSAASGIGLAEEYVRTRLVPRVRQLARLAPEAVPAPVRAVGTPDAPRTEHASHRIDVVVVGVSTGGPEALATVIDGLPAGFPVPVFVVQHMPPLFTKALAERLDRLALVDVFEARHGQKVTPGQIYVAPGGHHLGLVRTPAGVAVELNDGPKENSCRPSADVLFRSAAKVYGPGVLAVVLTGMGHDGLRGSEAVLESGGSLLAQSAGSSVVSSMPVAVAAIADHVVPLEDVAAVLDRLVRTSRR